MSAIPDIRDTKNGLFTAAFMNAENQYRTQFYDGNRQHLGTDIPEYTDIVDRVLSRLHLQADHEITCNQQQDS